MLVPVEELVGGDGHDEIADVGGDEGKARTRGTAGKSSRVVRKRP